MSDIFSVHQLITNEIASVSPNQDDMLRETIRELGSVKSNESELMSVGSTEICLTLNPKLHNAEGKSRLQKSEILTLISSRPRRRCQGALYRNQTLRPIHHPGTGRA